MQSYLSRLAGYVIRKISIIIPITVILLVLGLMCCSNDEVLIVYNNNLTKTVDTNSAGYKEATRTVGTVIESFTGGITGYGPNCVGCGGYSACSPKQDFRNGNIYYTDEKYGKLRIVAADYKYPCGSIVRINDNGELGEAIYAVVLDRGGAVGLKKKIKLDLLFASENDTHGFGIKNGITVDVLRLGW